MIKWKCWKCGGCCRHPGVKIVSPELWDEKKQQCRYLKDDNTCEIYENRPLVCRIPDVLKDDKLMELCKKYDATYAKKNI